MAANPDIKVVPVGVPYSQWIDKFTTEFEAGHGPDLFMVQEAIFAFWNKSGHLAVLDDLVDLKKYEGKWLPIQNFAVVDGKTYMLVREQVFETLIVNEQILGQAGVPAPKSPGELLAVSELMVDKGLAEYGFIFPTNFANWSYLTWWGMAVIRSFGGRIAVDGRFMVDSPQFIDGMEFLQKVYASSGTPPDMEYGMQRQAFIAGQAGMCFDGPYWFSVVQGNNPDLYPHLKAYPSPFPGRWTTAEINSMAINAHSSPEEQAAAAKLLEFIFTDEIQEKLAVYVATPTGMKISMDALANEFPWYEPYIYQGNFGIPHVVEGYEEFTPQIFKKLNDYMAEVMSGRQSAADACAKFQADLEGHFWEK
jgi:ABC-type glycerol-3-phosphate transport system substrate-binding protein